MPDHTMPGQLIAELLEARGWTKRTLAVVLEKDESTINKIVSGKGSVTTETALALEGLFQVPAERFLELQNSYDLAVARITSPSDHGLAARAALFGDLPISAMCKRGWIGTDDAHNLSAVESGLKEFFGVQSLSEVEILPHAAKKTAVTAQTTPAQLAWLYRVKAIASELLVPRFSPKSLDIALGRLKNLMIAPEEIRSVARVLHESGIRFLVVESLPTSKIDGVCFWLENESPVVALSLRFDRIDNFWFVLRHELEHVRLGHGKDIIAIDTELEGENAKYNSNISDEERLANKAAQNFCVPIDKMEAFVSRKAPLFSERDLTAFAKILKVHPGIVAGQLQHHTGRFDRFRQHLVSIRSNFGSTLPVDGWGEIYPLGA